MRAERHCNVETGVMCQVSLEKTDDGLVLHASLLKMAAHSGRIRTACCGPLAGNANTLRDSSLQNAGVDSPTAMGHSFLWTTIRRRMLITYFCAGRRYGPARAHPGRNCRRPAPRRSAVRRHGRNAISTTTLIPTVIFSAIRRWELSA